MDSKQLNEIKKVAESATPGKWNYDERVGCVAVYAGKEVNCMDELEKERRIYYQGGYQVNDEKGQFKHWDVAKQHLSDAKFIATCNPQTVLALLAHIDNLTDINNAMLSRINKLSEAAKKAIVGSGICKINDCVTRTGCGAKELGKLIAEQEATTHETP